MTAVTQPSGPLQPPANGPLDAGGLVRMTATLRYRGIAGIPRWATFHGRSVALHGPHDGLLWVRVDDRYVFAVRQDDFRSWKIRR
jgi:hypothetical protein